MKMRFKKTSSLKRIIVVLLAICLFSFVVTSSVFSIGIHHHCFEGNCIVCFFTAMSERITACNISVLSVFVVLFAYDLFARCFEGSFVCHALTPVCLKVKLSD